MSICCPGARQAHKLIAGGRNRAIDPQSSRERGRRSAMILSMADARQRINEWRIGHIQHQSHSALGSLMPSASAKQLYPTRKFA